MLSDALEYTQYNADIHRLHANNSMLDLIQYLVGQSNGPRFMNTYMVSMDSISEYIMWITFN